MGDPISGNAIVIMVKNSRGEVDISKGAVLADLHVAIRDGRRYVGIKNAAGKFEKYASLAKFVEALRVLSDHPQCSTGVRKIAYKKINELAKKRPQTMGEWLLFKIRSLYERICGSNVNKILADVGKRVVAEEKRAILNATRVLNGLPRI
jgi:hypothetical protein